MIFKKDSQFCFCLLIYITVLLNFGCSSSLTNKGTEEVESIREKYGCFEIVTGKCNRTEPNGKSIKFINIHFAKCKGELNYDSVQNYPLLRQQILEQLYPQLKNNQEYQGVNLEFDFEPDALMGNKNYLYLFDKSTEKLILSDSSFVDKF